MVPALAARLATRIMTAAIRTLRFIAFSSKTRWE
jgi:hypothetical protein